MICNKCKCSDFRTVNKKLSQSGNMISLLICHNCDPISASLENLENGFETGCKILGLQNIPKLSKIINAYEKFGLDRSRLIYNEDSSYIRCKGVFSNKEQFEVSVRK